MTAVIETQQLTKSYGPHRGIVDVDLTVNEGEAFGFLGPNGAGKTTTIRTLLDHIRPTSGKATIFGIETTQDPVAIHKRLGYLPGEFALYDKLTGGPDDRLLRQPARQRRQGLPGRSSSSDSTSIRSGSSRSTPRATSRRSGSWSRSSIAPTCSCSTSRPRGWTR